MTPARTLLLLLASVLLLAAVAASRCDMDEHCGLGGVCDVQRRCCVVRGCAFGCPHGQTCREGRTACGKFTRLIDTCACPRKLGCVWQPERREPRDWLDMFYDVQ